MTDSPEQIQREIDRTRAGLSANVDALADKVSPGRIVNRRVERVRGAANSVKDRVMGSLPSGSSSNSSVTDGLQSGAASVGDSLQSGAASVRDAATSAPDMARRQTQGNPLAAGLIAFGVGWLVSSLLPASQQEQQLGAQVKEHAAELAEPLKQRGQEIAQNLQEPAQQALEEVKSTASDAADKTKQHASSAAQDVKGDVKGQATSS